MPIHHEIDRKRCLNRTTCTGAVNLGRIHWGVCAIVATRDLVFGVSRVLEVRAEDAFAATQVFREPDSAEAWIASQRSRRPSAP